MVPTQHWLYDSFAPDGRYWRHGPIANFSETPCEEGRRYCALGEQTRDILRELGYSENDLVRLKGAKVVDWPVRTAAEHKKG